MQQVIITVKGGVPKVEVKCVKGSDCKKLTRALEAALGETKSMEATGEMYEQAKQTVKTGY